MSDLVFEKWEYDRTNALAIEAYAKGLIGKSFQDVIDEDKNNISERGSEDKKIRGTLDRFWRKYNKENRV